MFKVLIAVDGSDPSGRAIEAVGRLARGSTRLEVILLHVRGIVSLAAGELALDVESDSPAARSHQAHVLDQASTQARCQGLHVRGVQPAAGMAAQEIVRAASAAGVDTIVMGAHGRKGNSHYLLGSVAQKVLHLANVPVMLVR
jgi:nucleotide-binding universal stress UspA family protein